MLATPLRAEDASPVAATVEGDPIRVGEVQRSIAVALQGRKLGGAQLAAAQAQMLEQLVERRIVQHYLNKNKQAADDKAIDAAIEELKQKLATQKQTLEALLNQQRMTDADLRSQVGWELSWKAYAAKAATDEALSAFFDAHRNEFDGTEVAASHILLRPEMSGDDGAMEKLLKRAAELREQIVAGKISFADAAKKFSDGPSRQEGGDVGFFPRAEVMVEPFAKAAFALEVGEISEPVVTRFGVHLIRVTKVRPSEKKWTDVRDQLTEPFAQEHFQKLADEHRPNVEVKYTGNAPYLKPGTKQVVLPQ
jgi:peptidyl-prolyl cis-trans isomerase C